MTQDIPAGRTLPNPEFIGTGLIEQLKADYKKAGALSAAFKIQANLPAWSPVTSTYISDNGGYPDLAVGEIKVNLADIHAIVTTLSGKTPPQRVYHDIPSQDWRAGAFDLAQLSRYRLRGAGNTSAQTIPSSDTSGGKLTSSASRVSVWAAKS